MKKSVYLLFAMLCVVMIGTQTDGMISAETTHRTPVTFDPDRHEPNWIEVKFVDGLDVRLRDGELVSLSRAAELAEPTVAAVLESVNDGQWVRTHTVSEAELDQMRVEGMERSRSVLPDLNLYFRLQLADGESVEEVIGRFATLDIVEHVTPIHKPTALPLPPDMEQPNDDNPIGSGDIAMYQQYLDPAPDGIDAEFAWAAGNVGKGDGITICDVEYAFNAHGELPLVSHVNGSPFLEDGNHATAVLGVMGAPDNGWGVTGIAHEADFLFATSYPALFNAFGIKIPGILNVAAGITACANVLDPGDVIIIEAQTGGPEGDCTDANDQTGCMPVEWEIANYDAITSAVAQGIVVIEAGGNGNVDLDSATYDTGHRPFAPENDSGAIIVGAATSSFKETLTPRQRAFFSNHGDTVDLFAWGMDIVTLGYGDLYDDEGQLYWYTQFGGTSGASPIVAASAAIVQSAYKNANGVYATPAQVKTILESTGTAQAEEDGDNIGVMPNLKAALNQINGVTTLPAPVITPGSGSYAMPMAIDIDYGDVPPANSNNQMRYTLDGSEPTEDSFIIIPEFDETLTLAYGVTLKAKAWRYIPATNTYLESATTTVTFNSTTPQVAPPQISTGAGIYEAPHQVVLTSSTPGATIKYRTDGKTIGFFRPGQTYNGPITLQPGNYQISAVAYKDGFYKSDQVKSAEFEVVPLTLPAPTIYPDGGQFQTSATVHLSSSVLGGIIRYTTNGSDPTSSSQIFSEPIVLNASATVKARVFLNGYNDSPVTSESYTIIPQAATPTINPVDGTEAYDFINITMSTSTAGATIRYTTNGAIPQPHSTAYSGQFSLGIGQHTVKARAFINGAEASDTTTVNYTVYDLDSIIDPPNITPAGGNHNGPITVSMQSDTEDVFIFYTLDGTDPQSSSSVQGYNGPFQLHGDETYYVRARAFKSGIGNSNMSSATLVVVNPTLGQVQDPTISPPSGTYNNSISVQVNAPDHQPPFRIRRLFVTRDGTAPIVDFSPSGGGKSNPYSFSLSKPETVQAVAAQSGWFDSDATLAQYAFQCGTPTITAGGTFTDSVEVTMSTVTTISTIRYTTDGSIPDASSTQYNGAFTLGVGEHIVNAVCFRNNFTPSETATSAFIVNPTPIPPTIDDQPRNTRNIAINKCEAATFTVSATGTAPFTYQWYKDGVRVAGANEPELVIAVAQLGDAGDYTAVVGNAGGSVTSDVATLTVTDNGAQCESVPTSVGVSEQWSVNSSQWSVWLTLTLAAATILFTRRVVRRNHP